MAIPKIAQNKLNASQLQVDGISVTQTRSETYLMGINSTIRSSGGVSAKIAPFRAEMYLEDIEPHTPFVLLDFPETTSAELQTVNVTDKKIEIPDMDAFTTFNTMLLGQESVRVTIKGDTTVRVSGVARNYGVTFKKTIELTGLNHFAGLEVTQAEVTRPTGGGDNFHGYVTIPNPSVLTIEIVRKLDTAAPLRERLELTLLPRATPLSTPSSPGRTWASPTWTTLFSTPATTTPACMPRSLRSPSSPP